MDIEKHIREYIVENFLLGGGDTLSSSESLLETGVVDSTGVIELVAFLEEAYAIEVADEDLVPENLDSIANMTAFVDRKKQAQEKKQAATSRVGK